MHVVPAWLVWTNHFYKTHICTYNWVQFFCLCLFCQLFMIVRIAFERHFCLAWGSTVFTTCACSLYVLMCTVKLLWQQFIAHQALLCCTVKLLYKIVLHVKHVCATQRASQWTKPIVWLSTFPKSRSLQPPDFKHVKSIETSCLKWPLNKEEALYTWNKAK